MSMVVYISNHEIPSLLKLLVWKAIRQKCSMFEAKQDLNFLFDDPKFQSSIENHSFFINKYKVSNKTMK